jgi:hypothetical protein
MSTTDLLDNAFKNKDLQTIDKLYASLFIENFNYTNMFYFFNRNCLMGDRLFDYNVMKIIIKHCPDFMNYLRTIIILPHYQHYQLWMINNDQVVEMAKFAISVLTDDKKDILKQDIEDAITCSNNDLKTMFYKRIRDFLSDKLNELVYAITLGQIYLVNDYIQKNGISNDPLPHYLGFTALGLAAYKCQIDIVKLLLKNGADINAIDNEGSTPLICTVCDGYLNDDPLKRKIIKLLLKKGADPYIKDKYVRNALLSACSNFYPVGVVKELLKYMRVDSIEYIKNHEHDRNSLWNIIDIDKYKIIYKSVFAVPFVHKKSKINDNIIRESMFYI